MLHEENGFGVEENVDAIMEYSEFHSRVLILVKFLRYNAIGSYLDEFVHENFFVHDLCIEYVLSKIFEGAFLKDTLTSP